MNLRRATVALAALLLLAWASVRAGSGEFVDLGAGLLMRDDGSVVAAWEVPECQMASNAFDSPEPTTALPASHGIWQVRLERDR
jgi:hypothetical protein